MKRKKVVVVTTDKSYAEFLMNNMKKYMEAYADFECYSIKEVLQTEKVQADFFEDEELCVFAHRLLHNIVQTVGLQL